MTWCVHVSACVHFVGFIKWGMNVVGVGSLWELRLVSGGWADSGTGMNWRVLVGQIRGQGPLLRPQRACFIHSKDK